MKTFVLFSSLTLSACLSLCAATTPVFEENFNSADSLDYLNGAEQGPGLSEKPGDKAYSAKVDTVDPSQPQPGALVVDSAQFSGDMGQFTVTLWYKLNREIQDPDSLLHLGGFYLLWDKVRGLTMRLGLPPGGADFSNWFSAGIKGPILSSATVDEWIFYAITWDYDAKSCVIYQGSANAPVEIAGEKHAFDVTGRVQGSTANAIGNNFTDKGNTVATRPFSGQLDNLRVYDKVLDLEAIETIRNADLANTPPKVP